MGSPNYGVNKTFWACMDVLHTRRIEISYNRVRNAVRRSRGRLGHRVMILIPTCYKTAVIVCIFEHV